MVLIPFPQEPLRPVSGGRFTAPAVVPQQDATGAQLAGLGQGVQQFGFEQSRRADWQQDQHDLARIDEADNLTAEVARNAKAGYLAKVGRDAVVGGARKKADEDLDKRIEEIGASLENDSQRAVWARRAAARREAVRASMDGHETDQTLNYRKGSLAASIEASRIDGLKGPMLKSVRELSALEGEDETQLRIRELDATTKYWEPRIRLLAQSNPEEAAQMLTDASAAKEIHPTRLDELRSLVQKSDDDEKSGALFRGIIGEVEKKGGDLAAQEAEAKRFAEWARGANKVPQDVHDKTLRRIEHHFEEARQALDRARSETVRQAENIFVQQPATNPDTLPEPMREQISRLGVLPEVDRRYADAKARRLSGKRVKDSTVEENETLEVLQKRIKLLDEAVPPAPPQGASPEDAQKLTEQFEAQVEQEKQHWIGMFNALALKDRQEAEMPAAPTPKTAPKKSIADELREALQAERRERTR